MLGVKAPSHECIALDANQLTCSRTWPLPTPLTSATVSADTDCRAPVMFEKHKLSYFLAGLLAALALCGLAVLGAGVSESVAIWTSGALVGLAVGTRLGSLASNRRNRHDDVAPH